MLAQQHYQPIYVILKDKIKSERMFCDTNSIPTNLTFNLWYSNNDNNKLCHWSILVGTININKNKSWQYVAHLYGQNGSEFSKQRKYSDEY